MKHSCASCKHALFKSNEHYGECTILWCLDGSAHPIISKDWTCGSDCKDYYCYEKLSEIFADHAAEVAQLTEERDALASICAETIKNLGVVNDDDPAHLPNHAADVAANDKAGWKEAKAEAEAHDKTREGYWAMRAACDAAVRERDAAVEAIRKSLLINDTPHEDARYYRIIRILRAALAKIEGERS